MPYSCRDLDSCLSARSVCLPEGLCPGLSILVPRLASQVTLAGMMSILCPSTAGGRCK